MSRADRPAIDRILGDLLDAERSARRLRGALIVSPPDLLLAALDQAIAAARSTKEEEDRTCQLVSLAITLGHLRGPKAVDALVNILASDEPEARHAAGAALQELSFERFKEVALGVERALAGLPAGNPALRELPYLLAEVPEPGVTKLLARFLEHRDPEAVAAAIEAAVELGDPALLRALEKLQEDTRLVEVEDEDEPAEGEDAGGKVTLGELAKEAVEILSSHENEDDG